MPGWTGKCGRYFDCQDGDGNVPVAIVEVCQAYREPGSPVYKLLRSYHCHSCFTRDRQDEANLRRRSKDGLVAGVRYKRAKLTWLTTLVNGEVRW